MHLTAFLCIAQSAAWAAAFPPNTTQHSVGEFYPADVLDGDAAPPVS